MVRSCSSFLLGPTEKKAVATVPALGKLVSRRGHENIGEPLWSESCTDQENTEENRANTQGVKTNRDLAPPQVACWLSLGLLKQKPVTKKHKPRSLVCAVVECTLHWAAGNVSLRDGRNDPGFLEYVRELGFVPVLAGISVSPRFCGKFCGRFRLRPFISSLQLCVILAHDSEESNLNNMSLFLKS